MSVIRDRMVDEIMARVYHMTDEEAITLLNVNVKAYNHHMHMEDFNRYMHLTTDWTRRVYGGDDDASMTRLFRANFFRNHVDKLSNDEIIALFLGISPSEVT